MKLIIIALFCILFIFSCKKETTKNSTLKVSEKDTVYKKENTAKLGKQIIEKSEVKTNQINTILNIEKSKSIILEKHFFEENKKTVLSFHYPQLNEEINNRYKNFNEYVKNELVDETIRFMRENEEFLTLCDTIKKRKQKSIINYSLIESRNYVGTVFVIENYYDNTAHSVVKFKTVNYDLSKAKVLQFTDFFKPNSEDKVLAILNKKITDNINTGEMYYDCWEISKGDFNQYKNNFVLEGKEMKFYFDDCVVCPSYTGTYFIEVDKNYLKEYIKPKYLLNNNFDKLL